MSPRSNTPQGDLSTSTATSQDSHVLAPTCVDVIRITDQAGSAAAIPSTPASESSLVDSEEIHGSLQIQERFVVPADAASIQRAINASSAGAVLCLDATFPIPSEDILRRLLEGPADVWHAGLRLGLSQEPQLIDSVAPTWMLNAPISADIEVTSWRVSLRAVLIRRTVIEQLGGPLDGFDTLSGAALEAGMRWTTAGALVRHVPDLAPDGAVSDATPTDRDAILLIRRHYGRKWAFWALQRGVTTRRIAFKGLPELVAAARTDKWEKTPFYVTPHRSGGSTDRTVSVILPTIDRYSYLESLLRQLETQTVAPTEVVIVDQTPVNTRRHDLKEIAPSLTVRSLTLDKPGQSSARNLAINTSVGEMLLFLDDDDDIPKDLIEQHLQQLTEEIDAICGAVDEATAGPPPPGFRHRRTSDVFPCNNSMLRRAALIHSGLFDPSFDRGSMADHDLGMRLTASGALLVYSPKPMVFHYHAPRGGLRAHGARVTTRADSRRSITTRNLPTVTGMYLRERYFTKSQIKERDAIDRLAILTGEGQPLHRLARFVVQAALLVNSNRRIRHNRTTAKQMVATRQPIPVLDSQ